MAYELPQKVTLTNLFSDPSFEKLEWTAKSNCTISQDATRFIDGNYSLKIVTNTGAESYIGSTIFPSMVKNHKYYACVHKYQTSSIINNLQFYWPEAEPNMGSTAITNSSAKANGWYRYSEVDIRSNWNSGTYVFRIDLENNGKAVTAWYDNAMLIDLTAAFGSGNEPDQTWCDENIEFFIGTKTLSPNLPLYIKQSSQWKPINKAYIKNNGVWMELKDTELPNYINSDLTANSQILMIK